MNILYVKAIHIIAVVSWFAALFYIVRLFIYHTEAQDKSELEKQILSEQFKIMQSRLWYIIGWPAGVVTIITGFYLVYALNYWLMPWMQLKLGFVFLLFLYHLKCQQILSQLKNDIFKLSSFKLRLFNEVATIMLIAIVFTIILKSLIGWVWGVVGILGIAVVIMLATKLYKKKREKE